MSKHLYGKLGVAALTYVGFGMYWSYGSFAATSIVTRVSSRSVELPKAPLPAAAPPLVSADLHHRASDHAPPLVVNVEPTWQGSAPTAQPPKAISKTQLSDPVVRTSNSVHPTRAGWAPLSMSENSVSNDSRSDSGTIDVLIASGTVTCVLERVVKGLLKHAIPLVSRIYVLVPPFAVEACQSKMPRGFVSCINERNIIAMSKSDLKALRSNPKWSQMKGKLPGWYLAILLKMLAVTELPLSDSYLVWEADAILVKPYNLFLDGKYRITIGGWPTQAYSLSTKVLLGLPSVRTDMTTHHMVIHKPTMIAMIRQMCRATTGSLPNATVCAMRIVRALPIHRSGFGTHGAVSEYELYHNWALHKLPSQTKIADYCPFIRAKKKLKFMAEQCQKFLPPTDSELLATATKLLEETMPALWDEHSKYFGYSGVQKHRVFNKSRMEIVMLEVETVGKHAEDR